MILDGKYLLNDDDITKTLNILRDYGYEIGKGTYSVEINDKEIRDFIRSSYVYPYVYSVGNRLYISSKIRPRRTQTDLKRILREEKIKRILK